MIVFLLCVFNIHIKMYIIYLIHLFSSLSCQFLEPLRKKYFYIFFLKNPPNPSSLTEIVLPVELMGISLKSLNLTYSRFKLCQNINQVKKINHKMIFSVLILIFSSTIQGTHTILSKVMNNYNKNK